MPEINRSDAAVGMALFLSAFSAALLYFHYKREALDTPNPTSPLHHQGLHRVLSYTTLSAPYVAKHITGLAEGGEEEGSPPTIRHFPVGHLEDTFPGAETHPNPLLTRVWPRNINFVSRSHEVLESQLVTKDSSAAGAELRAFVRAGPHERLFFDPKRVKAAIVTCGGLCPGLNTVIREIVMCLSNVYGCGEVYGVQNGYCGFYSGAPWRRLTPGDVAEIHEHGGTVLGSSRGGFHLDKILNSLVEKGISQLFVIGGDGTHRGAMELIKGAQARGLRLSVVGVPKTIDNDIAFIDKSFGFDTSVEEAVRPIQCAKVEAMGALAGVGLVKLMGRAAGFIALNASMASRAANCVLLPEAPWKLGNFLAWLEERLEREGHAVVVVAEGAESVEQRVAGAAGAAAGAPRGHDASGNVLPDDVGLYLKDAINRHFKAAAKPCALKYIDPSYIIRSSPPCASDSNLCTVLAHNAVHGAMAGFTGVSVGVVENHYVFLPIPVLASMPPRVVDITGRSYARMCTSTGQPKLD